MRKLSLLAAAAMVAGGSAFAMEGGGVSISGSANFGVKFKENDGGANAPNELQFHHEFDIKFSASGTTDGGIGFGGSMSIDNRESVSGGVTTETITSSSLVRNSSRAVVISSVQATGINTGMADTAVTFVPAEGDSEAVSFTYAEISVALSRQDRGAEDNPDTANANETGQFIEGDVIIYDPADGGSLTVVTAENFAALNGRFSGSPEEGTSRVVYWETLEGATELVTSVDTDSASVDNHGEVYISMDMHKLTIGTDLDRGDQVAGGLKDVGFDGIGIDDIAEKVWAKTARDVRYDGDFGIAKVAFTYGDNKGDAEWAAGFSFNVEPVKVGAGFDSNGVISVGMGFTQGQISMNALYSTDSDSDEADNEAGKYRIEPGDTPIADLKADGLNPNKPDLKNQAMGVDITYKMTEATSLTLVAAQHKSESASWNEAKAEVKASNGVTTAAGLANLPAITAADAVDGKWVTKSTTVDAFGVGFSHDLGGGATLKAGAGSVDSEATADLGITMKF